MLNARSTDPASLSFLPSRLLHCFSFHFGFTNFEELQGFCIQEAFTLSLTLLAGVLGDSALGEGLVDGCSKLQNVNPHATKFAKLGSS